LRLCFKTAAPLSLHTIGLLAEILWPDPFFFAYSSMFDTCRLSNYMMKKPYVRFRSTESLVLHLRLFWYA
jgi:hypothetical protein